MKKKLRNGSASVVETEFAQLQDGSLVEMIEDPDNPAKSLLAVYHNGNVRYLEKLHDGERILVPLSRADLPLQHVQLPRGAEPYGDLRGLFEEVGSFFAACLDVDPYSPLLMTAYVLMTHFPEMLSEVPYLALLGPPGSGKTTALRILGLLCRRSLLTADISSAAFYDVCQSISPTLLIDETLTAGHPRTLSHLLRSSSSRGFVALRKNKAHLAFGPKVLSWVELPNDPQLISRCIIIPMYRTSRADLHAPDAPNVLWLAARVRMRLLQFRFEKYSSLSVRKIPVAPGLSSRALAHYRALALPIGEDPGLCQVLGKLIADQRKLQTRLLSPAQESALRVLYRFIHENLSDGGILLSNLTSAMNCDLEGSGEAFGLKERKTGDVLTSLGLTNRSRTNAGYVLWLYRTDRLRIHKMVRDFEVGGVPIEPDPKLTCDICVEQSAPSGRTTGVPNESTTSAKKQKRERREHRERHPARVTRVRSRHAVRLPGAPGR